ncbi:membrane protein [Alistipes dispar]|uniref:Membrane protein n=2 Tax=Alistipes dispar TaxID=2585119 RepID=A0A4Y1X2X6_9BACT|nr:membrane protein [Alistipes dispar]
MMIQKIKTYAVLTAAAFTLSSCLDKYPEDSIPSDGALTTVSEVNEAIIGIYASFMSSSLYSGNLTLLPDIQTDLVYGVNGNTGVYGDVWRWNDILSTNPEIESVYGALYTVINRCNFVLDRVDAVRAATTDDEELDLLDQCCGEAYFARALAYSELIKCFCEAYENDGKDGERPGVVLTKHYKGDEPMRRASLEDSYKFVLDDLDKAAELLKLEDDFTPSNTQLYSTGYFNEYTIYALRARVSLYMKNWEDAVKYATEVIDSGYYTLTSCNQYTTVSGSQVNLYQYMWAMDVSTETIWQITFTINSYGGALGTVFANYDNTSYRPDYVPAYWVLYDLYDSNDLRTTSIFGEVTTGYSHGLTWPLLTKYFGNLSFTSNNIYGVTMPKVFRLSEQYLIRAEAYVQQGDYNSAGKDITKLRTARYSSYGSSTSMTADNAMDIIEQERVKELYMEGFRLHDLKRWHKGFEREPQEQSLSNGSSLKVEADDPLFVWPIPQHELDAPGSEIEPNESNK